MRSDATWLGIVAGLSMALVMATLASAQEPAPQPNGSPAPGRAVTILPDDPEGEPTTPTANISAERLALLNSTVKVENPAGVSLDLIPGLEVIAGSKMGFRITTRKAGYLILLDVDATGKLTQIFPNTTTVMRGARDAVNLVKPGRPLIIPQLGSPYAGFEFVADAPAGVAMAVAMLSDKPVQVVDLPDAPAPAFAPADTLKYVRDSARGLRVPNPDGTRLEQPNWSFDGKFYLIK